MTESLEAKELEKKAPKEKTAEQTTLDDDDFGYDDPSLLEVLVKADEAAKRKKNLDEDMRRIIMKAFDIGIKLGQTPPNC